MSSRTTLLRESPPPAAEAAGALGSVESNSSCRSSQGRHSTPNPHMSSPIPVKATAGLWV
ncbi:hypothetical protein KN815_17640 [Streptomyces sp. 4503]|uniref:Uncharacterized protein n=1 Tax=Streptomyces niphimycinicus TaxID=2842201 RepID=A0ABS6CG22_9ACTN|nr:hypothetical protein [Streptomyces niphimycinicus]MBU3865828.1 hypothetical protein [Streptomyces niphimycinicus]